MKAYILKNKKKIIASLIFIVVFLLLFFFYPVSSHTDIDKSKTYYPLYTAFNSSYALGHYKINEISFYPLALKKIAIAYNYIVLLIVIIIGSIFFIKEKTIRVILVVFAYLSFISLYTDYYNIISGLSHKTNEFLSSFVYLAFFIILFVCSYVIEDKKV